jgi:hypothetical protein
MDEPKVTFFRNCPTALKVRPEVISQYACTVNNKTCCFFSFRIQVQASGRTNISYYF